MTIENFYRNAVPIVRYSRYVFNMNTPHILMFVNLCSISAMMKIKFHMYQKFHHQLAGCSDLHL